MVSPAALSDLSFLKLASLNKFILVVTPQDVYVCDCLNTEYGEMMMTLLLRFEIFAHC